MNDRFAKFVGLGLTLLSLIPAASMAGVLPEDRADTLYHYYDGGGVQIDGPSILVRKKVKQSFSLYGNYYVDSISSASIDVVTTGASPYTEDRTEVTMGLDYLHEDTLMSISLTDSEENDYSANSLNLGINQDGFGGMTTIFMGYGYRWVKPMDYVIMPDELIERCNPVPPQLLGVVSDPISYYIPRDEDVPLKAVVQED